MQAIKYDRQEDEIINSDLVCATSAMEGDECSMISDDTRTTMQRGGVQEMEEIIEDDASLFSTSGPSSATNRSQQQQQQQLVVTASSSASARSNRSRRSNTSSSRAGSRHQELKDDGAASDHFKEGASLEPDGHYKPTPAHERSSNANHATDNGERVGFGSNSNFSSTSSSRSSSRRREVNKYASIARKKASLMTNYNFEREEGEEMSRRSRASNKSEGRVSGVYRSKPPPPPYPRGTSIKGSQQRGITGNDEDHYDQQQQRPDPNLPIQSIGNKSIASSVSSMTSMDSYMKQQYMMREIEKYKRQAREAKEAVRRSQARDSRHSRGGRRGERFNDEDNEYFGEEYSERLEGGEGGSRRSYPGDDYMIEEENDSFYSRSGRSDGGSARNHSSNSSMRSNVSGNSGSQTKNRSQPPPPPPPRPSQAKTPSNRRGSAPSVSSTNEYSNPVTSAAQTSFISSTSTAHTPPLYQLEECCIKHPHILLTDQTDINVWTCMRYCKDEKSGRWITKKMCCEACLEEEEVMPHDDEYDKECNAHGSQYSFDKKKRRSSDQGGYDNHYHHHNDSTDSMSSSQEDHEYFNENSTTINIHPMDDGNQTPLEREAEAQRRRFIRRLAARAYHFPGNTWCEDWMQYTKNTHLVFGIFFHHPLHPVTSRERCIILLGSVAVGLLLSNLIYLWFAHYDIGINDTVISFGPEALDVTKLMIALWTLGSFVHTIFDLSVWHIKACTLCRYGGDVSDEAMKCGRTTGEFLFCVAVLYFVSLSTI